MKLNQNLTSYIFSLKTMGAAFYVSPKPWVQLFTISYIKDHHVVPITYALIPSKSQRVYEFFIYVVKKLIPDLNPNVVITDFEKASINAFQMAFPQIRLSRYLFDLAQNIHRKIRSLGIAVIYSQDENVQRYVRH